MKRGTIGYYRIYWRSTGEPGEEKRAKNYNWILQDILERHGGAQEEKHEETYDWILQNTLERHGGARKEKT